MSAVFASNPFEEQSERHQNDSRSDRNDDCLPLYWTGRLIRIVVDSGWFSVMESTMSVVRGKLNGFEQIVCCLTSAAYPLRLGLWFRSRLQALQDMLAHLICLVSHL